jgi:fumarate reductase flavoprotein subunit
MINHIEGEFDLIVVGGGLAGLTAAARAVELGLKPVVLEQGLDQRYPCNSRSSGGIFHVSYHDMKLGQERLTQVIRNATKGEARQDLIEAIAGNAGRAIDWLSGHGTKFLKSSMIEWHRWTVAPPRPLRPGLDFPGLGVDTILRLLTTVITNGHGVIALNCRAIDIQSDNSRLLVQCTRTSSEPILFSAPAVVIADGGFQANLDMLREHITSHPERLVQRGAATGRGDGANMALRIGASLTRADRFYGHPLHRDALTNAKLWPYPQMDYLAVASVVVGPDGRRFVDEGKGGVYLSNVIVKIEDPTSCILIFDETLWNTVGRESLYPANPYVEEAGGRIYRADTIEDLAKQLDLDPTALSSTIANYNVAVEGKLGESLNPPRTGLSVAPLSSPFMAAPLCVGITHTMGGLAVDGTMRVLDREGNPIFGLYAIGGTAGGLEGGEAVGYVGGLVKAVVMGLVASEHASSLVLPQNGTIEPYRSQNVLTNRRLSYSYLRLAARHGHSWSIIGAILVALLAASFAALINPYLIVPSTIVMGGLCYVILRTLADVLKVLCDVLLPSSG